MSPHPEAGHNTRGRGHAHDRSPYPIVTTIVVTMAANLGSAASKVPAGDPPVFTYRPALDGLRAVAVAGVLLFHGGVTWLPGGFLGVDAFFVLSGFLITSLLLAERARYGRIRLGAFWLRRARRLLPALLLVLVVVVVAYRAVLPAVELALLRGDALAALGYVANWRMIYRGGDYFTQTAAPSPLQHTWSLGIEEQFYLIWPLVVVGLLAVLGRRAYRSLISLCLLGAVASAATATLLYDPHNANRAYYGTDTRAQALLIGCALGAVLAAAGRRTSRWQRWRRHRWTADVVAGFGFAGVVALGWLWTHEHGTDPFLFRGGLAIGAVAVAAVIAYAMLCPGDPVARALSLPVLVWLGRISYGVYLWHWPLFGLLTAERTGLNGASLLAARIGATAAVAAASYVFLEQPVRTGRLPWPWAHRPQARRPRPAVAAVSAGALLAATGFLVLSATSPRTLTAITPVLALPAAAPNVGPAAPMQRPGRKPGGAPRITFFGDSVSWSLGTYLPAHPGLTITVRAIQGCGIARLPDIIQLGDGATNYRGCPTWDTRWQRGVKTDDPDVAVILLDRWELMDRKLGDGYHHVGEPVYDFYLSHELQLAISIAGSRGAQVVLLTAPYTHRSERPDGGLYDEDRPERVDAWNRLLYAAAARDPDRISVIDLNARVCPDHTFTWTIGNLRIRSDGLHFTESGVRAWIAPWLLPQLAAVAVGSAPSRLANPVPTATAAGAPTPTHR